MEQRRHLFEPLLAPKGTLMSVDQFKQFAAYNKWANARLYSAVLDLSEPSYRLHIGVFFGNLHGTLNHLLLTDRLWLIFLIFACATCERSTKASAIFSSLMSSV